MAKHYLTVRCTEVGCTENRNYHFTNRKDYQDAISEYKNWKCLRHSDYSKNRIMSLESPKKEKILINTKSKTNEYLFWANEEGKLGSGFQSGPGFQIWSKDFPEGTILKVTAEVILPNP